MSVIFNIIIPVLETGQKFYVDLEEMQTLSTRSYVVDIEDVRAVYKEERRDGIKLTIKLKNGEPITADIHIENFIEYSSFEVVETYLQNLYIELFKAKAQRDFEDDGKREYTLNELLDTVGLYLENS